MLEAYIPNISKNGQFAHQMSLFVDGKVRATVTALKPASFQKILKQIEKLNNGDRVYQISKFIQEPEIGLPVTMKLKDFSGVKFDLKTFKLVVDGDLADKGEKIEITIEGSVQNVDGADQPVGDLIEASVNYEIEFPKETVLKPTSNSDDSAATKDAETKDAAEVTKDISGDAKVEEEKPGAKCAEAFLKAIKDAGEDKVAIEAANKADQEC